MLSSMGYHVSVANSGWQGIQMATSGAWGLVYTDFGMEDLDAWEIVQAIREQCPDLPVYLLTGYGAFLDPTLVSRAGVAGVLTKPVSSDTLAALLQRHAAGPTRGHGPS